MATIKTKDACLYGKKTKLNSTQANIVAMSTTKMKCWKLKEKKVTQTTLDMKRVNHHIINPGEYGVENDIVTDLKMYLYLYAST
jgi:hypothetical protein